MKQNCFDHYIFNGTHREAGRQHGEALREAVREHIELTYQLARRVSGLSKEKTLEAARAYEPYIEKYAPGFMEEIRGMAEGAGISAPEALMLQARQEIVYYSKCGGGGPECTSYAVGREYTADGKVYAGQNADLAGDFESVSNVITFEITGKPKVMMVVPAGQISYIGLNSEGMSINCNFLFCDDWRKGFPRYLISRLLMEQRTFEEAKETLLGLKERASSRNFLLADYRGNICDFETTAWEIGSLEASGAFVHSNHYIDPAMQKYEKGEHLSHVDSLWRWQRLSHLFEEHKGSIDGEVLKMILRDHETDPEVGKFSLCTHESPESNYYHTFASLISNLTDCTLEVTRGLPCSNEYKKYEFRK